MRKLILTTAFALACVAAFALGGAALASALSGPANGEDAARAGDAAVRATGGGELLSVERSDDGAEWDVDVLRDGQEVEVRLDDRLRDVGTRRETEPAENDEQPLSADQARRAGEAALREAGGGSVESIERSDDLGETYEVEVVRSGREIELTLDGDFRVVQREDDD